VTTAAPLPLDEHGVASLDGTWDFFPGDLPPGGLDEVAPHRITVPALWEAQGWLELDGVAWYRRRFVVDSTEGWWSLRFGAVMDLSEVWLNGVALGAHDNAFTPFVVDPTVALRSGENVLCVKVVDPPVDDPEHLRSAHGKQGWANHVFPSRPSLYMTYGGIWQPVALRRHGPVVVDDVFVNGDPERLGVHVTVTNRDPVPHQVVVALTAVGRRHEATLVLPGGATTSREFELGVTHASRWHPATPALHVAEVQVAVDGDLSDASRARFGLRTVRIRGAEVFVNDEPYRMKSVLVQGFRADTLYGEGSDDAIAAEVRAAKAMGFNTLRLHIKGFDPRYLDACDELGMLVHSDLPIAEPVVHDELGAPEESLLARRSVEAVTGQIRRDRNHPCIVVWSVMNELGLDRAGVREWPRYERFARALVAAARDADGTRPVIENDWIEPDPGRVFLGDALTAHWYGRLHNEYLTRLAERCRRWAGLDRPLFVTEFGDWGLPEMPELADPPFWDARAGYTAALAETRWPSTIARFVEDTQRYQGLSDRLQIEVFRRFEHIGGYCLTELTDVPQELNGLLDLHRAPKPNAVREVTHANAMVLPMLELDSLVAAVGEPVSAAVHVANDGPAIEHAVVEVRFGDTSPAMGVEQLLRSDTSAIAEDIVRARFELIPWAVRAPRLEGHRVTRVGEMSLRAPRFAGAHDLHVRITRDGEVIAENRYPVHVVRPKRLAGVRMRIVDPTGDAANALGALGADVADAGLLVIGEDALDGPAGERLLSTLAGGAAAVVLAQSPERAVHFPCPVDIRPVETAWGSSVFHFTTDNGAVGALPRRNVLASEDSTVQARSVVAAIHNRPFPEVPVVIAYKPVPEAMTGTVIGSEPVGRGRLVFCQYRLVAGSIAGDVAARSLLADVIAWAVHPRPHLTRQPARLPDGRAVTRYDHEARTAS
jgi:hypothetical protein